MSDSESDFAELEPDFAEVMAILREGPIEPPTEVPGEAVWAAIAREIGGEVADSVPGPVDTNPSEGHVAPVTSLAARRSRGRLIAGITAVAAAILLVVVPLALATGDDSTGMRARLVALDGFSGSGTAELKGRTLAVDIEGSNPPQGSFYELWLLDLEGGDVQDLRSLGRVDADGNFVVPDEVDLSRFRVVDVSVEPDDGNPDHSGDSVLRGGLEQA